MITERERAERRRIVAALTACAAALAITITATTGVVGDELAPAIGPQISTFGD